MAIWKALRKLTDDYDADFKCSMGSRTYWSGQLRVTLTNPPGKPSRSIVFFSVGQATPEAVAERVVEDFHVWREAEGVEPLPVPDWIRGR